MCPHTFAQLWCSIPSVDVLDVQDFVRSFPPLAQGFSSLLYLSCICSRSLWRITRLRAGWLEAFSNPRERRWVETFSVLFWSFSVSTDSDLQGEHQWWHLGLSIGEKRVMEDPSWENASTENERISELSLMSAERALGKVYDAFENGLLRTILYTQWLCMKRILTLLLFRYFIVVCVGWWVDIVDILTTNLHVIESDE